MLSIIKMLSIDIFENKNKRNCITKSNAFTLFCDCYLQKVCEEFINKSGQVDQVNMNIMSTILKGYSSFIELNIFTPKII